MTPWQRYQENSFLKFTSWLIRQEYIKQVIAYGLGMIAVAILCLRDYRRLARWSLVIYWISIILLILVLVPGIGATHGWGASRWIDLGPLQFQPSEFSKLALLAALSNFLSRPMEELRLPGVLLKATGMIMLPFGLILLEPDLGSAMVVLPLGLALMFVAGVPKYFFKWTFGIGGAFVLLVMADIIFAPPKWRVPLKEYQRDRLLVYFGRDFAPRNATPEERKHARERQQARQGNVVQAMIAVGSGGLTGKGWGQGTQNALGYLPGKVAHNDFIFSVIAEEKGFLGSVTVLALYTVILFSGIRIAGQARDRLGKLLAIGVVTMLFSHVFINIGMNISLMPVTGIPLPLLSYGGTSVLCTLVAAGILQNISIYRRAY
jgi:rod shape determining protein RodA